MLLDIVDSQIQREEISINSSRRVKDSKAGCTSTFRRNMQIFDKDLHMVRTVHISQSFTCSFFDRFIVNFVLSHYFQIFDF